MIAALAAGLALAAAALPEGAARYRAELGGVPVGLAELRIACAGPRCEVRSLTRLRRPAEAGGGVDAADVEIEVDREGRFRGGPLRVRRGGVPASPEGLEGAVPSALVEVVLAAAAASAEACVPFFDEERPSPRRACARPAPGGLAGEVGGVAVWLLPGEDGFPREVAVAGRFRWVRDARAEVPERAPPLAGTRVAGPSDPGRATALCGVRPDPTAGTTAPAGLPPPRAAGESCREKTAAWLAAARARGLEGRAAVGVAWDGAGFVWHEWAEVRAGRRWIPVDPSFGEAPARGPRFTLARFRPGDGASRDRAGARILACWGAGSVEEADPRSPHGPPRDLPAGPPRALPRGPAPRPALP